MKRRNFLSATGAACVSSLIFSKFDDQTVALDFDINPPKSIEPNSLNSLIIDFEYLILNNKYIEESSVDISIIIKIEENIIYSENYPVDISPNGGTNILDRTNFNPIYVDGLSYSKSYLDGEVTLKLSFKNTSESYRRRFSVSGGDGSPPSDMNYRWVIDEGSGSSNIKDTITGAEGTIEGASWINSSDWIGGNSLSFDGSSYVSLPDESGQYPSGDFTIYCTIEPSDLNFPSGYGPIIDLNYSSSSVDSYNGGITLRHFDDGSLNLAWYDSSKNSYYSNSLVLENQKARIAAGRDTSLNESFMYINGAEDFRKSCTTSDVIYNYDSYYDDNSVHIGKFDRNNLGSGPKYYRGKVDDLIITDSSASETEVEDDYINQPWS